MKEKLSKDEIKMVLEKDSSISNVTKVNGFVTFIKDEILYQVDLFGTVVLIINNTPIWSLLTSEMTLKLKQEAGITMGSLKEVIKKTNTIEELLKKHNLPFEITSSEEIIIYDWIFVALCCENIITIRDCLKEIRE